MQILKSDAHFWKCEGEEVLLGYAGSCIIFTKHRWWEAPAGDQAIRPEWEYSFHVPARPGPRFCHQALQQQSHFRITLSASCPKPSSFYFLRRSLLFKPLRWSRPITISPCLPCHVARATQIQTKEKGACLIPLSRHGREAIRQLSTADRSVFLNGSMPLTFGQLSWGKTIKSLFVMEVTEITHPS